MSQDQLTQLFPQEELNFLVVLHYDELSQVGAAAKRLLDSVKPDRFDVLVSCDDEKPLVPLCRT